MFNRGSLRGVLLGALLTGVASCGGDAEAVNGGRDGVLVEGTARVINVETTTVELQEFVELIRLTGIVLADQDVTISAQESGVIRHILVDKGTAVREGQALFQIDDDILQSQVQEATAQVALANETWERRKRLYEEDQVGSELAYLEAKYNAEQSGARLAMLKTRLGRTVIRAPISGVLETRIVEVGTMVNVGTDVARVVSLDPIKVAAGVPERYAADVAVGTLATVRFDVLNLSNEGAIGYVGATVDSGNRTFPIELVMANPDHTIKPQMVANVAVVRRMLSDVIVVPQEALVRVEAGFVAFVVEGTGQGAVVVSRSVTAGASQQNRVVIEEGLEPGDRLIVVGQQQVSAGDRVNVVGTR
jgi:membrane fusion protein (multidrug efflux system)